MSKKLKFSFPTKTKEALRLLRLEADLQDLADGSDDVDEAATLTRSWAAEIWRDAKTYSASELARAAAGHDEDLDVVDAGLDAAEDVAGAALDSVGWSDVAAALKPLEKTVGLSGASVSEAMAGLGFERAPKLEQKAGCLAFRRDKHVLGVRLFVLGNIRVAEMAVAHRKGKNRHDENHFGPLESGSAATYVAGNLIEPYRWEEIVDGFVDTVERAIAAVEKASDEGRPRLPVDFAALKRFVDSGKDEDEQEEDAEELAEIRGKQDAITARWLELARAGRAPKGLMLQFDGPDGAGKTSSSKYIPQAILRANQELEAGERWTLRTEIFKVPTAEDKEWMAAGVAESHGLGKWLARHCMRGMPEAREILIKDRFQPGDYVYVGEHTPERLQQMAQEIARYEQWVHDQGILTFKAILWANPEKQAKTFGKRMGRGGLVDAIVEELQSRGTLTDEQRTQLEEVKHKVENTDLVGLTNFEKVLPHFQAFGEATDCPVVEATRRHAARVHLLDLFLQRLADA